VISSAVGQVSAVIYGANRIKIFGSSRGFSLVLLMREAICIRVLSVLLLVLEFLKELRQTIIKLINSVLKIE